ncbi:MAG: hypothetical protein WDO19_30455 [Bacteroidota bacterium]
MKIFKDTEECISYLKDGIKEFSFLNDIIKLKDFNSWTQKLDICESLDEFLLGTEAKLNLLNITIATGLSINKNYDDRLFSHYRMLLNKLDLYLQKFPELKANKKFKDKLKNIEGLNFLSTLSELSLGFQMAKHDLSIKFETKFKQLETGKNRDVDLSVYDKNDNIIHIEVYMPNKQLDVTGFFDPNQDDKHFESKIENKLSDKFGKDGIAKLNGLVLLAVNKIFFDMLHMKTVLPFFHSNYKNLIKFIPKDVDGLLIFEDGFESIDSCRFEKLLLKDKNSR